MVKAKIKDRSLLTTKYDEQEKQIRSIPFDIELKILNIVYNGDVDLLIASIQKKQ